MTTVRASDGSQPISDPATSSSSSQSPAQIKQARFDLGIACSLGLWNALSTAVSSSWGGPDSQEKRDWFAGAVSDLFTSHPDTDEVDLECVLLQVMEDEFDVRVEDESEVDVAARICGMRRMCERGDFSQVDRLYQRWTNSLGKKPEPVHVEERMEEAETDSEDDEGDEDGGVGIDQDMVDAEPPRLVPVKEQSEPEVDADGFMKVTSKKRR